MSITSFTILVLVVYLVFLKVIGLLAYRRAGTDTEDYFLSNREVPMLALVVTTMASLFSTGTIVSSPSEFFTKGSGYFWVFFFILVPVMMMLVVDKFWKLGRVKRFVTPAQLLENFYGSKRVMIVTAVAGLLSMIPHAAAQMVAVGKTFEALTGGAIPYSVGVSSACLAIGLYVYVGGARAVIWTDVVQGTILGTLLLVSGFLVVHWAGGWGVLMEQSRGARSGEGEVRERRHRLLRVPHHRPWPSVSPLRLAAHVHGQIGAVGSENRRGASYHLPGSFLRGLGHRHGGHHDVPRRIGRWRQRTRRHLQSTRAGLRRVRAGGGLCGRYVDRGQSDVDRRLDHFRGPEAALSPKIECGFGLPIRTAGNADAPSGDLLLEPIARVAVGPVVNNVGYRCQRNLRPQRFGDVLLEEVERGGGLLVAIPWTSRSAAQGVLSMGQTLPTPLGAATWAFGVSLIVFVVVALLTNGKGLDSKREEFRSLLN